MCGGINVLKNIKVPWDLTCDEIIYVLEGTFRLTCDGETYICNRGDVLFVPKDNHISYEADDRKMCHLLRGLSPQLETTGRV